MSPAAEIKEVAATIAATFARKLALYALISAALAAAIGFSVAAAWRVLADQFGSTTASLSVAAAFLALASLLFIKERVSAARRRRRIKRKQPTAAPSLAPLAVQTFTAAMEVGRSIARRRT